MVRDAGTYIAIAAVAGVVLAGTVLRAWALLLVAVGCVVAFVLGGAEALAWLWLFIALPALLLAAGTGWALRAVLGGRARVPPVAVASLALVVGGALLGRRASLDPVPPGVARLLPHEIGTLGTFCFAEIPAAERRTARGRVRALARELRRRPDELVSVEYVLAESSGTQREDRTVRELAAETLDSAGCDSPEATALRRALRASG